MSTKAVKDAERIDAIQQLRKLLKPGQTVYTVLRSVSRSGMSRRIDLYMVRGRAIRYLTGYVARVLGYRQSNDGEIVVGGCGMDMGWALVYELSRHLFPKGFIPAKAGRSGRNGTPADQRDLDGGYALQHEWL